MKKLIASILLLVNPCVAANADIWKWVDEDGNVHFSDTPALKYAVNAELVSYTPGNRSALTPGKNQVNASRGNDTNAEETREEKRARQDSEAYYCNRAKEIYDSYVGAPRLYRTGEDGRREYLSDQETAAALAKAEASVAEWCN